MRLLGIDYGTKRVGLALSDGLGLLAHPYATLTRTTRERLFEALLAIIAKENVQAVVLGLPLGLNGQETETTRQVRNFAASLARRVDVPILFENEALSSKAAKEQLCQARLCGKKRLAALDQQAAVIILSDYLKRRQSSQH